MNTTARQITDKYRMRLMRDFELYAKDCLKIRTKTGETLPFALNRSQLYLHQRIEAHLAKRGRVRMLVLKSRQIGSSTYLGGRFYWKVTHRRGQIAQIIAHEDKASQNLFNMAKRFHDNVTAQVKPSTGAANAKELLFNLLDSGYNVSTAGNKGAGRSSTIQYLHGSEVAFWPNAEDHVAGVLQALADADDSEAYFESTANGIGNVFYRMCKQAERGEIDFELVFIPWYWHEEYSRPLPPGGWVAPGEWEEYQEAFNLTDEQTFWAYRKNAELLAAEKSDSDPDKIAPKFKQEYPATSSQAFETSGLNCFISPLKVLRARKASVEGYGPIILGVDPARGGKDKSGLIDRQGRRMGGHVCERVNFGENTMALAAHVKRRVLELLPLGLKKVCVDTTGLGGPVYDRLVEILPNAESLLEPVNFASQAHDPQRYANRRAEMWDQKRQWYDDPAGVQVPDSDEFQGDECAPQEGPGATHYKSNGQLILESKEKIRERLGFSPDEGDAGALTFAPDMTLIYSKSRNRGRYSSEDNYSGSSWAV